MNAIILSAGFGIRCAPLTYHTPKGLLKINNKPLIEHAIERLHEKGIHEIIIIVGYKKEMFKYLAKQYGVKLVYNPEYSSKNTLSSLCCVLDYINSTYIIVSDNFATTNLYNTKETTAWTSCVYVDGETDEWCLSADETNRVTSLVIGGRDSFIMIGPAYFSPEFSKKIKPLFIKYNEGDEYSHYYWEDVLRHHLDVLPIYLNDHTGKVFDFDDLDELRKYDAYYQGEINYPILRRISSFFDVPMRHIYGIKPLKEGMTNDSFYFTVQGKGEYIYRVPGVGSEKLINRKNEYEVYKAISDLKISDKVLYFESGHKISEFIPNAKNCDPQNLEDIRKCMKILKNFHEKRLSVEHTFNLYERIEFYESLWRSNGCSSDYLSTREKIFKLRHYLENCEKDWTLCHIDSVSTNFLIHGDEVSLIDWEYAGMQDPHVDIAFFISYCPFSYEQANEVIDSYFLYDCGHSVRKKIYGYIAVIGFLWFNWCEFTRHIKGVKHGEYALLQYKYAQEYYEFFINMDDESRISNE